MESYFQQYEAVKDIKRLKYMMWRENYNIIPDVALELLRNISKFDFLFDYQNYDRNKLELFIDNDIQIDNIVTEIFSELVGAKLPIDILEKYSKFFYWRVKTKLIRNYDIPIYILEEMALDRDSEVCAYAKLKLEEKLVTK